MCSEIIISFPNAQAQKHEAQRTLPTCVSKKLHIEKLNHIIVNVPRLHAESSRIWGIKPTNYLFPAWHY